MGVLPSVMRTTALVVHPAPAVFACTCTRVTVIPRSSVHEDPVQVLVSAPGKNIFCSPRGAAFRNSPFNSNLLPPIPFEVLTKLATAVVSVGAVYEQPSKV